MMRHQHEIPSENRWQAGGRRWRRWLWGPLPEGAGRAERLSWAGLRIVYLFFHQCRANSLPLRASALTFAVVLSLVPTLALGTAVLKGLGAGDQMRTAANQFIGQLEESGKLLGATPEDGGLPAGQSLAGHLRTAVDTAFAYVDKTNFATLGLFGVLGLVLAVLSMMGSIEVSINAIWQVAANRTLGRKVIDYLSLLILLPLSIYLALTATTVLQSPTLFQKVQAFLPVHWLQHLILTLLPLAAVIGTFTLLYQFLPNTRVRLGPAVVGGLGGGLAWLILQSVYIKVQIGVARYNAIYGSFATLPLFLIWLYMGWLCFLAGVEISFVVQNWRSFLPAEERHMSPFRRLSLALSTMALIHEAFLAREVVSREELALELNRHEAYLAPTLAALEAAGLIRHIDQDERQGYVPAAPAASLPAAEIVAMVLLEGGRLGAEDEHPLAFAAYRAAEAAARQQAVWGPGRENDNGLGP